jgi:glycosyltransferase involved in cell wall biosynthesis
VIGGDVAGGQLVALRLALAAREAGHEVAFVSPTDGPFLDRVRAAGLAAHLVPLGGALDLRSTLRLARALRSLRADLVHTHGHFAVNVHGRLAGRLAGARVLAHMHIANVFRAGRGRSVQVALDNGTARLCFALVAVSEATAVALREQGYPAGRLVVIPNGVEGAEPAAPVELAPRPAILEVARLAEVKGQHVLLEAVAQLDAHLVLAGRDLEAGGAYERQLRARADELGIAGRVVFAGPRDDVPGLLAGADVFCLPSFEEGLPLTVLEAMAQARPVVATAVGGTPEAVVDGETGLLVPPGDAGALAEALRSLLEEPERARRLGEAGRDRVRERFSAEEASRRVLALYRSAA